MSNTNSKNASTDENQKGDVHNTKEGGSAENKNTDTSGVKDVELTEEQLAKAFEHKRFKELVDEKNEYKTKLDELAEKEEAERQKKLKEEGDYEELIKAKDDEIGSLKDAQRRYAVEKEVLQISHKENVVDSDAVLKLLDLSKINYDDNGNPIDVEASVKNLLSEKPYLVNSGTGSNIGSGVNSSSGGQGAGIVMTLTELRQKCADASWYEKHKDDIKQWQKEGLIDNSK